jgi:hypothetical protein
MTCGIDIKNAPYSRPLLFNLPSGFGLCNGVSSVVNKGREKCKFPLFYFAHSAFAFFAFVLLRAPGPLFSFALASEKA